MRLIRPRYRFIKPNSNPSYNNTFLILKYYRFLGKDLFASEWIGKITKKIEWKPDLPDDLDERCALAYRLGKIIGVNIPETDIIKFDRIENNKELVLSNPKDYYDFSEISISKKRGDCFNDNLLSDIEKSDLLNLFIFDCWIGNFDKKPKDYVRDEKNKLWGIDYQLWGPCDSNITHSLGYCAYTYDFTIENIKKYCLPDTYWKYIQYDTKVADKILTRIENINRKSINKIICGLSFYNNEFIVQFLENRCQKVRLDIRNIFGSS